jgi:Flp pilus assembly pilin Flp
MTVASVAFSADLAVTICILSGVAILWRVVSRARERGIYLTTSDEFQKCVGADGKVNAGKLEKVSERVTAGHRILRDTAGQTITEYSVLLAVTLVLVMGTAKLIHTAATFSTVGSSLHQ